MVDGDTQDVSAGPASVPSEPDAQPGVDPRAAHEHGQPPAPAVAGEKSERRRPSGGLRGALAGALSGLVVAALAFGGYFYLFAPGADVADNANRLAEAAAQAQRENAALETEAKRESAAVLGLDKRVSTLEAGGGAGAAGLEKRVAALEAAGAQSAANAAATQQSSDRSGKEISALRADIDAARGEIPGLTARVAKLETQAPRANDADLSALAARIDKVESALAAPKNEAQVAYDNAQAIAIVAGAIAQKLAAGAPFGTEVVALERLGVGPANLAALRAAADGAATGSALAASFDAIAPRVLAAAAPEEKGGIVDRLLAHMRGLVRVHDLVETTGDDPAAIVSRVEADSRRGDIAGALAAFDTLPPAARQAAGDWAAKARMSEAARAALQSIRDGAIGRLAGAKP